ncbi:MAG: hypothetical protein J0H15_10200 [Xanthomonadales bacterium]|nr:hypothetical protein [Xanthomonadales bacterium]
MNSSCLRDLRSRYAGLGSDDPDALQRIATRHAAMRRTKLLDLAAVATSLTIVDRDELDELALRAIRETNPTFDPSRIGEYSEAEWMGITNAAKGKYFEYLVVDRLNAGEIVGDLYLGDGQSAMMAGSMTQPGWDIQIVDDQGQVVELLQLKATESAGYVSDALARYPDIRIVATNEAAVHLAHNEMVLDARMDESDLAGVIDQTLHGLDPGVLDQFWEAFNPLLPALIIAATQGYQVVIGRQRVEDAFTIAIERAARGLVAGTAGAVVKVASGSVWLAIPAGLLGGWWYDRFRNIDAMASVALAHRKRQEARRDYILKLAGSPA